ncbi:MAG: OmpA family protein [Bacteroidia bacterium]
MQVNRWFLYAFTSLILIPVAHSQTRNMRRHARIAEDFITYNKYDKALPHYLYLLDRDSTNFDWNFKAGICYSFLPSHKNESVKCFSRASRAIIKDSIPDLYYYLGIACQRTNRFDEAMKAFQTLERLVGGDIGLINLQNHIDACQRGKDMLQHPADIEITNLGPSVNSDYPDYAPVMSADESTLIFTSKRPGSTGGRMTEDFYYYEDVYISHRLNEDDWARSSKMDSSFKKLPFLKHLFSRAEKIPQVNTNDHDACISMSPDGKRLFLSRGGQVYFSDLNDGKWSSPSRMENFSHDKKDQEPSLILSADGKTMFVVSDRKGGFGGKDIYKSMLQENGKWSDLENLGPEINTELDEDCPFIQADTLYFSSQGHNSIGGYDVFKSIRKDGKWTSPENLGSPINTGSDDVFFILNKKGDRAYYASEGNSSLGDLDIFAIDFAELNPKIKLNIVAFDAGTSRHIPATVRVHGSRDNTDSSLVLGAHGTGMLNLKPSNNIRLTFHSEGFMDRELTVALPPAKRTSSMLIEAELKADKNASGQITGQKSTFYIVRADLKRSQLTDSALALRDDRKSYWEKTLGSKDTGKIMIASFIDKADTSHAIASLTDKNPRLNTGNNLTTLNGTDTTASAEFKCTPIVFNFNENKLLKGAVTELHTLSKYLLSHPASKLKIDGYTDSKGSDAYNLNLSRMRAMAAQSYLVARGIKRSRLTALGHGKAYPAAPNEHPDGSDNPEGRQQNRRVEFTLQNTK